MVGSLIRTAIVGILCAGPVLTGANRVFAEDDPLEKIVDEIVKGSSPSKEEKNPNEESKPEKLDGGITRTIRKKDGVEIFTRPDGTKQYVTPDNKKVTIRPNGERVFQAPGEEIKRLPPKVDDPDNYRPHGMPQSDPPADPKIPIPQERLPEFRMPNREDDGRRHATWDDLKVDPRMPAALVKPSVEELPRYTPPVQGTDDKLVNSVFTGGRTGVFTYGSGAIRTVLPDGREVTTYPGLPQVNVRDSTGKVTAVTPDQDGGIRIKGADTMTIDPATGRAYVEYANGNRERIGPDGSSAFSDGKGGVEFRDSNGKLLTSTFNDKDSGYSIRQDGSGVGVVFKDGKPVGVGVPDRSNFGYQYINAKGEAILISELVNPKDFLSTVAGRQANAVAYKQPPPKGNYTAPPPGNIFEITSGILRNRQLDPDTALRLKAIEKAGKEMAPGKPDAKAEDELKRALKLVDATLKKSDLEREAKQVREQLSKQNEVLDKEKKQVGAEKAQLLLRQTKYDNERKSLQADDLTRQVERGGLTTQKITLDGQEAMLLIREKGVKEELDAALKRVDYSKYNLCPNKEPWNECGHGDLKKKWLNAQLAGFLGKAGLDRLTKAKQDRDEFAKAKKELAEKEQALKQKDDDAKEKRTDLTAKDTSLKEEVNRLSKRENEVQKQIDQDKAKERTLTKQMADLDAAIKQYANPPQ